MECRTSYEPVLHLSAPSDGRAVGNKAANLFWAMNDALVPRFLCVDANEMQRLLKHSLNRETDQFVRTAWVNKLNLSAELSSIQRQIQGMFLPQEWIDGILCALRMNHVQAPYAVRSSSSWEDGESQSAPGIFCSTLQVEDDGVAQAIKACWSSAFSMNAAYYFGNKMSSFEKIEMGVIIQSQVVGTESGILFTRDPVTLQNRVVIEVVQGLSNGLTDGTAHALTYFIPYETSDGRDQTANKRSYFPALIKMALKLKEKCGKDLDIEWAFDGQNIYLVQVRPITTFALVSHSPASDQADRKRGIYSITQLQQIVDTSCDLEIKIKKWNRKKRPFYVACDDNGIARFSWFFVHNAAKEDIPEIIAKIEHEIPEGYVSVAVNQTLADIVLLKAQIVQCLLEICSIYEDREYTVSIRSLPVNQMSFISSILPDGNVLVEGVYGVMKGLKSGTQTPSTFLVDHYGNIIKRKLCHSKLQYMIQFPKGNITLEQLPDSADWQVDPYIKEIAHGTNALYQSGLIGAVEWWLCDGVLYASDISSDEFDKMDRNDAGFWISRGRLEGTSFEIGEQILQILESISYGVAISVTEFDDRVLAEDYYKQLMDQLREFRVRYGRIILCTKRPVLGLAPLLDFIDGVLFEQASLLCHLSVILREKEIPGKVLPEHCRLPRQGTLICISYEPC